MCSPPCALEIDGGPCASTCFLFFSGTPPSFSCPCPSLAAGKAPPLSSRRSGTGTDNTAPCRTLYSFSTIWFRCHEEAPKPKLFLSPRSPEGGPRSRGSANHLPRAPPQAPARPGASSSTTVIPKSDLTKVRIRVGWT